MVGVKTSLTIARSTIASMETADLVTEASAARAIRNRIVTRAINERMIAKMRGRPQMIRALTIVGAIS